MKTNFFRPFVLAGLLLLGACSSDGDKDPDPAPGENEQEMEFSNCRVVQTDRIGFSSYYFQYDDQGRLTQRSYGDDQINEISYGNGSLTIKWYNDGELHRTQKVVINAAGLAIRSETSYEKPDKKEDYIDFQYDEKNQLIRQTTTREGETFENHIVYQWLNGNLIAESKPDGSDMTTYTYDENERSQPAHWFHGSGLSVGYFTIRTKNRVTSVTLPGGDTYTHTYDEDEQGLIQSVTIDPPSDSSYTREFTYECD